MNDGRLASARERAFKQTVKARGARYVPGWWVDGADPPRLHENPAALASWVGGLPRPIGVFACADSWARIVAPYAEVVGVRIPEDVALLGVDNDTIVCEPWRRAPRAHAARAFSNSTSSPQVCYLKS